MSDPEKLFAVAAPGLEPFVVQELTSLGLLSKSYSTMSELHEAGGVEFFGGLFEICQTNLHLRTASRVLLRLGEFHAAAFSELHRHARHLSWKRYISPGQTVSIRVTCHKSRLYHTTAIAREMLKAISSAIGGSITLEKTVLDSDGDNSQLVIVRLINDQCTISIDTSGQLLHRRGYRLGTAKAPLRETLAAGLVLASGWDCSSPFLDPFCGSGTIAIEAALLANKIPPGIFRRFAFMNWPSYQPKLWSDTIFSYRDIQGDNPRFTKGEIIITASDRDVGAVNVAKSNADRAGIAHCIEFSKRSVSEIDPKAKGWLVTNPPYGVRVKNNHDLRNLYAQLGNILHQKCPGWRVAIMCNDPALIRQLNLTLDLKLSLINGGIPVRVARGVVPE